MKMNWPKIFIYILLIFFCIVLYKNTQKKIHEPMTRYSQPYIYKENAQIYDSDYAEIYDTIHRPEYTAPYELNIIMRQTQCDRTHSVFLDVQSNTGYTVHWLQLVGFRAFGVDTSPQMVENALTKYPDIPAANIKTADPFTAAIYEPDIFTHVLMNYYTVYQWTAAQKMTIFKNTYVWLRSGGYLVVHLVNPLQFDITPASKRDFILRILFFDDEAFKLNESHLAFEDFDYHVEKTAPVSAMGTSHTTTVREKIKDPNGNVRENKRTLYLENIQTIVGYATDVGFSLVGKIDVMQIRGKGHYLYIFQK